MTDTPQKIVDDFKQAKNRIIESGYCDFSRASEEGFFNLSAEAPARIQKLISAAREEQAGLVEEMEAALVPVAAEILNRVGNHERLWDTSWNLEYEKEISLSISECRAIEDVFAKARAVLAKVTKKGG